jgi:hypothetical protein
MRGDKRKEVSEKLLSLLNYDVNHIVADKVSMDNYPDMEISAAAKSCKNLFKHCFTNPMPVLILDNDNLSPNHWKTYLEVINKMSLDQEALTFGYHYGEEDHCLPQFKTDMEMSVVNISPEDVAAHLNQAINF